MKLLLLKLLGLIIVFTIISCKLSLKKSSSHGKKSSLRSKKSSLKAKSKSNLPDDVTFGFASNDNILQNAAVSLNKFSIFIILYQELFLNT